MFTKLFILLAPNFVELILTFQVLQQESNESNELICNLGDDNGEGGGSNASALGGILSSGVSILSSLSGSSGGLSNGSNGSNGETTTDSDASTGDDLNVNVGEGVGPY